MPYVEFFGDLVGDGPVMDQIQKIKIYVIRLVATFQTAFGHAADGTTVGMLEHKLRFYSRFVFDFL